MRLRTRQPGPFRRRLHEELVGAIGAGAGRFAPRESLLSIWSVDVLKDFAFHERIHLPPPYTIEDIRTNFIQTISILVYGDWDDWPHFDSIFLLHQGRDHRPDRTDQRIPDYDIQTLACDNFLGLRAGNRFFDDRHLFCPIDVVENSSLRRDSNWKLPFLEGRSRPCGRGGFGRVTKEVIAARHYVSESGLHMNEKEVACKVFGSTTDFIRERNTLNILRNCQNQNERIVLPLATVIIGDQPNIIFPLAEMDLDKFLTGDLVPPETCDMPDLLNELMSLAGALVHLHTTLGFNTHGCHADLKCANILVYRTPEGIGHSAVGKWMITDFGLSIVGPPAPQRRDSINTLAAQPDTNLATLLRQMPGAYHAPEVRFADSLSRSSDIWSFGCIMVRVLAFKLDGVSGLQKLDRLRGKEADGTTDYAGGHDYFNRGNPPILNPHIAGWIEDLPNRYSNYSAGLLYQCADLLRLTLAIDKNDRPDAISVQARLGKLRSDFCIASRTPSESGSSIGLVDSRDTSTTNMTPPSIIAPPSIITPPSITGGTLQTEALFGAIGDSNLSRIQTCLDEGVNVEKPDREGDTPLGFAASTGKRSIVERLLEAGAQVDGRSAAGKTPLMLASRNGHEEVARLLLQHGADFQAFSNEGFTCLHYATWGDASARLLSLLVENFRSVDVRGRDITEDTPLVSLIKKFVPNTTWEMKLQVLVSKGADINAIDKFEKKPIDYAKLVKSKAARELLQKPTAGPMALRASIDSGDSRRSSSRRWWRQRVETFSTAF
ncbi:hypothetical protein BJY01DRAFT_263844 [Aspergillus pseudoustus]|uniref:Protein kinase domain-containing protein n=1 Tax=Aspergillus pseudoustus TaxID=1810923 RepID=A0ABR4JWZ5_9EURO